MPLGGEAMPEPGDCDCQLHKDIVHWRDNYYWQGALTTGGLIEITLLDIITIQLCYCSKGEASKVSQAPLTV